MSSDWFEEAMAELDDIESDEIETGADEPEANTEEHKTDEAVDEAESGAAETEPTATEHIPEADEADPAGDSPSETTGDSTQTTGDSTQTAETGTEEPDPFGFGSSDSDTDDSATAESDPFGFGDGAAGAAESSSSATEFDADTGEADEFGFGPVASDASRPVDTADDDSIPTDAVDSDFTPTDAVDGDFTPVDADSSAQTDSSMAQSADEFGFSLDETADSSSPAPTAQDSVSTASTEPRSDDVASTDDQPADDPFGFGTNSGSTSSMEGGDDDFGFGGFGGGGGGGGGTTQSAATPEEFDDDEFESDIDRIDLGIDGLDDMILGGVPERSLIGIIGGAGTGKTTFGLQFLNQALKQDQRAVFITLEQTEEAVLSTAEEKGWPFRQYVEDDMLAVVVLDPVEMANSLASIRGDISRLIREFGASRLVLDSVSLLEMMYDHPAKRRSEVFDFTRSLKNAGVTTLLTSEASEDSSHASRYGAVEYLTDAVFVLRYVRTSNFEETRLAIEIQKIRDANHSRATKPYDLTDEGMSVHKQANIF